MSRGSEEGRAGLGPVGVHWRRRPEEAWAWIKAVGVERKGARRSQGPGGAGLGLAEGRRMQRKMVR